MTVDRYPRSLQSRIDVRPDQSTRCPTRIVDDHVIPEAIAELLLVVFTLWVIEWLKS